MVDLDTLAVADLGADELVEIVAADLEDGSPWPLPCRVFDAVVVVNYLHRPLFPDIIASVAVGGLLIYETFALGNEKFGRPSNPDFLLQPEELLTVVQAELEVLAFEQLEVQAERPAVIQHVAATRPVARSGS